MTKKKATTLRPDDIPKEILDTVVEVDLTHLMNPRKDGSVRQLKSEKIDYGKLGTFWKARNKDGEIYWTDGDKSPQIIDTVTGRQRGNIAFANGDVGKLGGRPKGASNRITAKEVCDRNGGSPAEAIYAIMSKDPILCRKYNIKDTKTISPKLQFDAAKELYSRMEGNAKANALDANGDVIGLEKDADDVQHLQVYIPHSHHQAKKEEESGTTFILNGDSDE